MEIYLTPRYEVEAWDSAGVVMDVMPALEQGLTMRTRTRIHIAHIAAGGTLGEHPATRRQIFAVVQGLAHIDTDGEGKRELPAGSLVIWESGSGIRRGRSRTSSPWWSRPTRAWTCPTTSSGSFDRATSQARGPGRGPWALRWPERTWRFVAPAIGQRHPCPADQSTNHRQKVPL